MQIVNSILYMIGEMAPYILLGFLIAGIMHAFIPKRLFSQHLANSDWRAVLKAAAIGVPLPLCSCGVLPTAIAMRRGGASKAATTSFLIATPQTGVDSIAATYSLLGPAFAIIRPVAALITALFGGMVVGHNTSAQRRQPNANASAPAIADDEPRQGFVQKCLESLRYGFLDLPESIGTWLVAGLIIAALITVYVPTDFFAALGSTPIVSMLVVLVIAIPMYVCATGSIPIAMALMLKGLSPGTALVLLMAGPAVNFASFALISREMGKRTALIYVATIAIGAIAFGLAADYLLPRAWFAFTGMSDSCCCGDVQQPMSLLAYISSGILIALLLIALIRKYRVHQGSSSTEATDSHYRVQGMNCAHCRANVEKAIKSVEGVTAVNVDLSTGMATVQGSHQADDVIQVVKSAGYDITLEN